MSIKTAKIHSIKYLEVENTLYPQIQSEFEKIENDMMVSRDDIRMIRFSEKVNKALRILKSVDTSEISEITSEEILQTIEHNINFMYDDLLYIQRRLLGYEYVDDLKGPVMKYLKHIGGDPSNYRKWAQHPDELAHKFIGMLTHPDNVETYKNQIKRMALGTMSQKEFEKIFHAAKHKMIPAPSNKFESFDEYKK